ncbi:MAG TPA: hypothetical protein VFC46_07905 [Humisphaera sp.]|nr:hypothetical protein [Humisphaera sp.]
MQPPFVPVNAPPTPGAATGLIATLHAGDTTDAKASEYHLTPNMGIGFAYPLTPNGYVPMAFSWRGMINIPAGGAQGAFHITCTGESELMIDGKVVTADHPGDAAASFEHPQNLAEGLHAINATAFHLHGTGARQRIDLSFKPAVGLEFRVPSAWCWHLRADEPADFIALKPTVTTVPPGARRLTSPIRAGTPRPSDPLAQLTDVLPGVVQMWYGTSTFARLIDFYTIETPCFSMILSPGADGNPVMMTISGYRWRGKLKIDSAGKYRFDMPPLGAQISVDGHIVTLGGFSNDVNSHSAIDLASGYHDLEVAFSQVRLASGRYHVFLQWEVNGRPYEQVPISACFHTRAQEPYADSAPNNGPANVPVTVTAPAPVVPATPRVRVPVPSDASQAQARKKLKTQFATFYSNPTMIVRSSLVEKLLAEADSASDPAGQYSARREAAEIAVAIGDLKTLSQCTATIAASFQVDELDVRLGVLSAAGSAPGRTVVSARNLMAADLTLAGDAAQVDNYDVATKALSLSQGALNAANEEALTVRHRQLEKEIRECRSEYLRVAPIMKKLAETPDDRELNLKAGRFYCLTSGNWKKGLPMLQKGSDMTLTVLAQNEAAKPSLSDAQLQLADGWWDHAAAEKSALAAAHCKQRAGHWYRRAAESSVGPAPERAMARFLATANSIDLLARFNPNSDIVSGKWTANRAGLSCFRTGTAQVQFSSYKPPEEYDYIIQFTVTRLFGGIGQLIPARNSTLPWWIYNGNCYFDKAFSNTIQPISTPLVLGAGKSYTSILQVRRHGIRAIINGVVIADWRTEMSDVAGRENGVWKLRDPRLLGFGSAGSDLLLEVARVVDLSADPD